VKISHRITVAAAALLLGSLVPAHAAASSPTRHHGPTVRVLASGLDGGLGSTIGPDGALYVTETDAGRLSRIDRRTGAVTTVASGLPTRVVGTGGAMDVAFVGRTPYVLVTLVGPDVGGGSIVGLYRVDGPHAFTVVADIGAWSIAHPPVPAFFVPSGVQFALQRVRGGFLVSDGHHNRVLEVGLHGSIRQLIAFDDVVPTGLAVSGRRVLVAQAGPVPHLPQDGKIVSFTRRSHTARTIASGGRLLVDVEVGPHHRLYALSQGVWPLGNPEGSPALPDTGRLLRVRHGHFTTVVKGLDRPTSLEIVGHRAYVVTLDGHVLAVDHLGRDRR
jgi:sugar lactone lactonase YvrE